jgi:hypothetical protein
MHEVMGFREVKRRVITVVDHAQSQSYRAALCPRRGSEFCAVAANEAVHGARDGSGSAGAKLHSAFLLPDDLTDHPTIRAQALVLKREQRGWGTRIRT